MRSKRISAEHRLGVLADEYLPQAIRADLQPAGLLKYGRLQICYFLISGHSLSLSGLAASSGEIVATSL